MFEASLKRTNTMASQGQLWLQLSGAAIAFLEMFAYMVAPFALLMLLALGGNGVAAAAKYLQLILFVNMWPITAVMVNAYVKKVATADLDTWSTLNSQSNAVTWMGLPGACRNIQLLFISSISTLCSYPCIDAVPDDAIHSSNDERDERSHTTSASGLQPPHAESVGCAKQRKIIVWGCESYRADKHRPRIQWWRGHGLQ
nr:hypothetical protein [Escherichia coli]